MLLAVDCGNTSTKFGLYEGTAPGGRFARVFRLDTDARLTAADYRARFDKEVKMAGLDAAAVTGAAVATVVPAARAALVDFAQALIGRVPVVVGAPSVALGLKVLIDRPEEAGADRLVAAVAAHAEWPGCKIVLDFGTATTFDVVTADGDYAGGVIAPGVNLALDALHAGTAQLPRIKVARPARVIGTGTVAAMESGIYWGYVGLIEGIVARIKAEWGSAAFTVIATGGLAALFAGGTSVIDATDPDLTLRGIVLVHQLNRPQ
ncbi:MAG: type III pantothenate kinase [Alphaproteobacteria bacterium]|nr:type III pantothenate kinase [Alphaproteobacteria bacterium]